jgi:hypothetical protein
MPRCENRALTSHGDQETDFTAASFAPLPLGIGANPAIFTVANAVLLKPAKYLYADRLAQFLVTSLQGPAASIDLFHIWQQKTGIFTAVAALDAIGPGLSITSERGTSRVSTSRKLTSISSVCRSSWAAPSYLLP